MNRYEDFSECFAMYCEEQEPGATGIFNTVSNHFESSVTVRFSLLHSPASAPPRVRLSFPSCTTHSAVLCARLMLPHITATLRRNLRHLRRPTKHRHPTQSRHRRSCTQSRSHLRKTRRKPKRPMERGSAAAECGKGADGAGTGEGGGEVEAGVGADGGGEYEVGETVEGGGEGEGGGGSGV